MAPTTSAASTSRLRNHAARYRQARQTLRTPDSWQSRYGLDWTNFFLADVQTGFGTFVAFYLAGLGWSKSSVGLALTTGTLASVVMQVPGGALADAVRWKRALVAVGIVMIAVAALILAFAPSMIPVFLAELLHGATGGIVTPAIGAISLGLVGRRAMSLRTGRNFRYSAAGHALTAGLMGTAGSYFSKSAIFIATAILCVPALAALKFIRPQEVDYRQARNAAKHEGARHTRIRDLLKNRRLILFTAALVLFQLADASLLPLMGENLAGSVKKQGSLLMAGLIAMPQIVVAVAAPWVGYHSEKRGRKLLLLIGFALEPIRAGVLALTSRYAFLVAAQILDGVSSAIITVLTVLVITDLTAGTGRFNLARGFVGAMLGIAASLSTLGTGYLFQFSGPLTAFLTISAVAGAATLLIWIFVSETKPADYDD
jgi:predicted MFS family arabinose efflux permease